VPRGRKGDPLLADRGGTGSRHRQACSVATARLNRACLSSSEQQDFCPGVVGEDLLDL